MKRKGIIALIATFTLLSGLIVGCSSSNTNSNKSENTRTVNTKKKTPKYYFKDNKLVMSDIDINITNTKVIQPGETGNEYGDKPIIAFWYTTKNKSDKDIDPTAAWISAFKAVQDNDKNKVNELDVGSLPDNKYLDSQTETIKKNGTVENAISYELDDTTTPVKLSATKGYDGTKLGTMTYNIK